MEPNLECWRCGAAIDPRITPLPLERLAQCRGCGADLRTCRMCRHHAPQYHTGCDQEQSEGERDATLANYCEWFVPRPDAHAAGRGSTAQDALGALFGAPASPASPPADDDPAAALRALFGDDKPT